MFSAPHSLALSLVVLKSRAKSNCPLPERTFHTGHQHLTTGITTGALPWSTEFKDAVTEYDQQIPEIIIPYSEYHI